MHSPFLVISTFSFFVFAMSMFVALRSSKQQNEITISIPTTTPTISSASNFTLTCLQACDGLSCNQSTTSGVVFNCINSNPDPLGCGLVPWCTTYEANNRTTKLHYALVQASLDSVGGNASLVLSSYSGTTTTMTASTYFSSFILPFAGSASIAISLLNEFLLARSSSTTTNENTVLGWFDDQSGWWKTSLATYNSAIDSQYQTYIKRIKEKTCIRKWQMDLIQNKCIAPVL